jgi:hypothetical protein
MPWQTAGYIEGMVRAHLTRMNRCTETHVLDLIPVVLLDERPASVESDPDALRELVYQFVLASTALRKYAASIAERPSRN